MDITQFLAVLLLVLFGAGVIYYLLQLGRQHRLMAAAGWQPETARNRRRQLNIQRDFARVFSMTGADGKERLIRRWMDRAGCDRTEAMRLAVEEWRRDNR